MQKHLLNEQCSVSKADTRISLCIQKVAKDPKSYSLSQLSENKAKCSQSQRLKLHKLWTYHLLPRVEIKAGDRQRATYQLMASLRKVNCNCKHLHFSKGSILTILFSETHCSSSCRETDTIGDYCRWVLGKFSATGLFAKQLITGCNSLKTGSTLGYSCGDSHIRNCLKKDLVGKT